MKEQKKSIGNLQDQETNTDNVKGGFNPENRKPIQRRTSDGNYAERDVPDKARPTGEVDPIHSDRNRY